MTLSHRVCDFVQVFFKATRATFVANLALMSFLTVVNCFHVRIQIFISSKLLIANNALVWFLSCVNSHVFLKVSGGGADFVTELTLIRFLTIVNNFHVTLKMVYLSE